MDEDRMLKWFKWDHLPPHLQEVSAPFGHLAHTLCNEIARGPERTVALRKLLEAKDAAVRAKLEEIDTAAEETDTVMGVDDTAGPKPVDAPEFREGRN